MWWTNPYWLAALILIIPIIKLGNFPLLRRNDHDITTTAGNFRPGRSHGLTRLTLLRVLTIVAVVLALAGTTVMLPSNQRQLVVLFDVSASIAPSRIEQARSTALRLIGGLKPKDRVAVVTFAGEPQLLIPFSTPENTFSILAGADLSAPLPGATNLQAALRLGKELAAEVSGIPSVLLFTDGYPTAGGGADPVLQSMKEVPVNVIPIGRAGSGLFAQGLDLPENVHPDEPVLGYWKIETDQARTIFLSVKIENRVVIRKQLDISPGRTLVPLNLPGQKIGTYRVMVEAADEQGEPIPGAHSGGVLQVKGPARVMVVNGSSRSPIGETLRIQGMNVEFAGIGDLPETVLGLTGYGAIVLDNIPALYLSEAQQTAIQSYVAGGGGLLVVGGDVSLGRGEYYTTKLEEVLPVQTDTRQRLLFTRANILFVIDHSGSMSEMVGNTSKQLAAMEGVMGAIEELNPIDEVGILAFDTFPTWILPFTPVSSKEAIRSSLTEIGQGGGTDLSTALEEVSNGFRDRGPVRRHTVILTDGLTTSSADFKELSTRLRRDGVSVTTIGIGEMINEELLRNIATWGDGRFYRADVDQIPKVILKETLRVTRDLIQEGSFQPKVRTQAPLLSGLDQVPEVKGYLITKPKNLATVYWEIGKGDPLLASWRYGSGQAAVFTSDSGGRWLSEWPETGHYNLLWSQLVRAIERGSSDAGLRVHTRVEAGNALIEVEDIGAERRLRTGLHLIGTADNTGESFKLQETAPGHYQALVSLPKAGLETFRIHNRLGGDLAVGWIWNQPGEELPFFEPDLAFLGQLASASGGKIWDVDLEALPEKGWTWKKAPLQNYLVILALLLLVLELGYRSASLGQIRMARALLDAWWEAQNRLIDLMRGFTFRDNSGEDREQSLNEAYRYLAERARRNREVADKKW